jgi:hypothetical protein
MLDGNAYNSSVPSVFGSLPNLQYLFLSEAFISGDLSYMQGMPNMVEHWINLNPALGGTIPSFLGDITTLRSFAVSQASLTGTIPSELGKLSNMVQMWLYGNLLEGQIPSEIGGLAMLETFQVEGNAISGPVPTEICALRGFSGVLEFFGSDCTETAVSLLPHSVFPSLYTAHQWTHTQPSFAYS